MNNNDISWFSLIKIPKSISPTEGLEFMYLDPVNQAPIIQPILLNDQNALSYTLSQINNHTISSFLFNDQPPTLPTFLSKSKKSKSLKSSQLAHAKGIVMYTSTESVYITHSIPLYPNFKSTGQINTTVDYSQTIYAQDLMCVSMSTSNLFSLLGIMALIQPDVYYSNIVLKNDNVTKVIGDFLPDLPPSSSFVFKQNGFEFSYVAKSQYSGLDLWDNSVSGFFKSGLNVESWGRPYMASSCPPTIPYPVLNTASIKIGDYAWKNTQDHSKWALVSDLSVICYGDMNRMLSQRVRGGGTICLNSQEFYNAHRKIIVSVNPCNT